MSGACCPSDNLPAAHNIISTIAGCQPIYYGMSYVTRLQPAAEKVSRFT